MQGKTAIQLCSSIHQMTKYITDNVDKQFGDDFYDIIRAFKSLCDVICKKCDGQRKDIAIVNAWISRIQYFMKMYYKFVGKYRDKGKRGKPLFGFKIHLLHHVCDWIEYWRISPSHVDEQRIEHLHVVINRAIKLFSAIKGRDKLKHIMRFVSLHSLF
eukprot:214682_1